MTLRQADGHPWPALIAVAILLLQNAAAASDADAALLLAFKDSFVNGNKVLDTWISGKDPCVWEYIVCNSTGFVERISLVDLGLVGTMPPGTGWVLPDSVQYLELGFNNISGSIPAGWRVPTRLNTLFMANNLLSGSISPDWDLSGSQLQYVLLQGNNLSGTLPDQWKLPPRLASLMINNNSLSGTIPTAFTTLKSLLSLMLNYNRFSGTLPKSFSFNTTFSQYGLAVKGNLLSGPLPSWPDLPNAQVVVQPGNEGLCIDGQLPSGPKYFKELPDNQVFFVDTTTMALCSPVPPDSSSSNTGLIVGLAVGLGGAAVLAGAGLAFFWRQVKSKQAEQVPPPMDSETGLAKATVTDDEEPGDSVLGKTGGTASVSNEAGGASKELLASDPLLCSIMTHIGTVGSTAAVTGTSHGSSSGPSSSRRQLGVDVGVYEIPYTDLRLEQQIGSGSFARVYLANWRQTKVACKLLLGPEAAGEFDIEKAAEQVLSVTNPVMANLEQEASLMAALRHPNVLSFIGLCITPPCLIMEYCPRGSLHSLLHQASTSPEVARRLTWTRRLQMARGAALGMLYLHSYQPPIIHRDLKSPNVLVESDWTVKISDFNLSKILGENSLSLLNSTGVGNPRWLAPEVLAGESHSLASDVFSYGLVLWELLTFKAPWDGAFNPWQISSQVMAGERPPIPDREQLPGGAASFAGLDDFIALMRECWAQKPQERPLFIDIVARIEVMMLGRSPTVALGDAPAAPAALEAQHASSAGTAQGGSPGLTPTTTSLIEGIKPLDDSR